VVLDVSGYIFYYYDIRLALFLGFPQIVQSILLLL
jgi:hypothetical protein